MRGKDRAGEALAIARASRSFLGSRRCRVQAARDEEAALSGRPRVTRPGSTLSSVPAPWVWTLLGCGRSVATTSVMHGVSACTIGCDPLRMTATMLASPAPTSVSVSVSFSAVHGRSGKTKDGSRSHGRTAMNSGERPRPKPLHLATQLESVHPEERSGRTDPRAPAPPDFVSHALSYVLAQ